MHHQRPQPPCHPHYYIVNQLLAAAVAFQLKKKNWFIVGSFGAAAAWAPFGAAAASGGSC